jgi:pectate disaccharide-lyase
MVRRCIAFNNGKHGFTYNRNLGTIEMTNNTAYNNTERNFNFDGGTSTFKNNLSYFASTHTNDKFIGTLSGSTNGFWVNNAVTNFSVNSADFVSLTPGANSNPIGNGFLNLASGSDLINAGATSTGITYNGSAPDIGAVESGGTTAPSYTLTVNASPSGGGTITRNPNSATYAAGTVVTLTAQAASGYVFSSWSGGASGTSSTTTVTVNADMSVTANFTASNNTPSIVLSATAGDAQVALSWTVTNITLTGQEVYRDTDPDPAGRTRLAILATSARTYTDATPSNGTAYYYWVKGIDATTTYNSNAAQVTPQGSGGGSTIRLEDSATPTSGYCSADGSRQNSYAGASNGYYINISNSLGKGINWRVNAAGGTCTLVWRYANAGSTSATTAKVLVNGVTAVASVPFPKSTSWTTWITTTATVTLASGINTIRLETISGNEFANIDWLEVTGSGVIPASCGTGREEVRESVLENGLSAFPNPSNGIVTLQFDLQSPGEVKVVVLNLFGQRIININKTFQQAGRRRMDLDLREYVGMHIISVQDTQHRHHTKVMIE